MTTETIGTAQILISEKDLNTLKITLKKAKEQVVDLMEISKGFAQKDNNLQDFVKCMEAHKILMMLGVHLDKFSIVVEKS